MIVNNGSGWHEDDAADAVLGTSAVPWAVAGLADGGAAFTAKSPTGAGDRDDLSSAARRGSPGSGVTYPRAAWRRGPLALFREGGALRAIGSSAEPPTFSAEEESTPPPGAPPILVNAYPLPNSLIRGVLRQTPAGWSDEEHELNEAHETPGDYRLWDTADRSPTLSTPCWSIRAAARAGRSAAWPTPGIREQPHRAPRPGGHLPLRRARPRPQPERAPIRGTTAGFSAVAVGGGAACGAPCATRSDTGIGPKVWLRRAIAQTEDIPGWAPSSTRARA